MPLLGDFGWLELCVYGLREQQHLGPLQWTRLTWMASSMLVGQTLSMLLKMELTAGPDWGLSATFLSMLVSRSVMERSCRTSSPLILETRCDSSSSSLLSSTSSSSSSSLSSSTSSSSLSSSTSSATCYHKLTSINNALPNGHLVSSLSSLS